MPNTTNYSTKLEYRFGQTSYSNSIGNRHVYFFLLYRVRFQRDMSNFLFSVRFWLAKFEFKPFLMFVELYVPTSYNNISTLNRNKRNFSIQIIHNVPYNIYIIDFKIGFRKSIDFKK
uniref:Uncharacterized protein n=1 Tax=Cacopsylla melanoneura TaxID=428564 RepID=A0A8D9B2T9_9HEMI